MKFDKIYKEVENKAKDLKLMEKYYDVKSFPNDEPYFTTSQETDILELIYDGLNADSIIEVIKKW